MAFQDIRMPKRICEQFEGGPTFATSLSRARSGYVTGNVDRPDPIWVYEAGAFLKDFATRNTLMAFFLALKGMGHTFRFRDMGHYWTGCAVYGGTGDITPLAASAIQSIGTGNGAQTAFQLYVPFTFGAITTLRKITKPCKYGGADTAGDNPGYIGPRFYVNNVLNTSWTLDTSTGIVTFAVAPPNGHTIKWAGLFDVHTRWQDDSIVMSLLESPEAANMKLRVIEEL
jgi:uncharacterized protein (TIGR02217 family)